MTIKPQAKPSRNSIEYFNVFAEKQYKGDDRLIRVGAAFPHKESGGFNVQLDALPIDFNGKLVILPNKEK